MELIEPRAPIMTGTILNDIGHILSTSIWRSRYLVNFSKVLWAILEFPGIEISIRYVRKVKLTPGLLYDEDVYQ